MSFLKSLCLAVLATIFITYIGAAVVGHWFELSIHLDDKVLEPVTVFGVMALSGVVIALVVSMILVSVFGVMIFIALLVAGSIVLMLLGSMWPVILLALIIYWLIKPEKQRYVN